MTHYRQTFYSMGELVDYHGGGSSRSRTDSWSGGTLSDALHLARHGWPEGLTAAMPIAEHALELFESEHTLSRPVIEHRPSGGAVDVGAYLAGSPSCMVSRRSHKVSQYGSTISLCSAVCCSGAVSTRAIKQRGQAVVALALAIERTGHAVELWADCSYGQNNKQNQIRVLIKGVNDVVDPETIAYVFSHPTFPRQLCYPVWRNAPIGYYSGRDAGKAHNAERLTWDGPWANGSTAGGVRGSKAWGRAYAVAEDLSEGTIYLPALCSDSDVEEPQQFIEQSLVKLGLIEGITE